MRALRGLLGLAIVVGVAQSCTNDFDKFDLGVGGATPAAGTTSRGGTTVNTGGTIARGGTNASAGGDTGAAGDAATAGADATAGAPSAGGAGGAPEGCQQAIDTDILHCGECDRACSSSGVAALECGAGTCVSSCAAGFANCSQPAIGADDGCETDVSADAAQCGGCDNACPAGFACSSGQCACDNVGDCGNGGGVDWVSGQCECDSVLCRPGEQCRAAGGDRFCSCNDSDDPGCAANEFCCASGCTDVESSEINCGACGRTCTSGFECASGACECDSAEDCGGAPAGGGGAGGVSGVAGAPGATGVAGAGAMSGEGGAAGNAAVSGANAGGAAGESAAGASGSPAANIACVVGRCVCSGNTCSEGQRCLPNGSCG